MNRDTELERLLAETDAELPPPPSRHVPVEQLRRRSLQRRGIVTTLVIGGLALLWPATGWSAANTIAGQPDAHVAARAPDAAAALRTALHELSLRLQLSTTAATRAVETAEAAKAALRERRVALEIRSQLAAVRANAATTFFSPGTEATATKATNR